MEDDEHRCVPESRSDFGNSDPRILLLTHATAMRPSKSNVAASPVKVTANGDQWQINSLPRAKRDKVFYRGT